MIVILIVGPIEVADAIYLLGLYKWNGLLE